MRVHQMNMAPERDTFGNYISYPSLKAWFCRATLKQELSASHALAFAGKISQTTLSARLTFWVDAGKCTATDWMRSAVPPLMGMHWECFGAGAAINWSACHIHPIKARFVLATLIQTQHLKGIILAHWR
ncbi:hypothetical protein PIB30_052559 [Stylosanthes scabra]|uniref:Uncharacterized protein n=1 Tax=Stylosanthes scabra TaxID=79078 RepID=A0ABU6WJA7_9FABA|nr:hypothetical protein [Stylosanthes scabra]